MQLNCSYLWKFNFGKCNIIAVDAGYYYLRSAHLLTIARHKLVAPVKRSERRIDGNFS